MASWENWQKLAKGKNLRILTKVSSFRSLSMVLGQERKLKCRFPLPFQIQIGRKKKMVIDLLFLRNSCCLSVCLILCPEKLAGQQSDWNWEAKICVPFTARVLPSTASSQGNCLSFSLLAVSRSGSLSWEGSIFCALFEDPSFVHGVIQLPGMLIICPS